VPAVATVALTVDTGARVGAAVVAVDVSVLTARIAELMAAGAVIAEVAPGPLLRALVMDCSAPSAAATVAVTADTGACTGCVMPELVALSEPARLAGAEVTDDATELTAWIAELTTAGAVAGAVAVAVAVKGTPEPLARVLTAPCSAVPAAVTVPVTADTGAWPA
jgi:hypothetical protein